MDIRKLRLANRYYDIYEQHKEAHSCSPSDCEEAASLRAVAVEKAHEAFAVPALEER